MGRTNYLWDEVNDTLLRETDENGNVIVQYAHEPTRFGPLISQRRNGHTYIHHYDGLGSTRALTDESGVVTDRYTYTAFGEPVASSGMTTNPFGYKGSLGYYTNPETNDLYVRARRYQRMIGRWTTRDPLGDVDGLNAYLYTGNDPGNRADPSGEYTHSCNIGPPPVRGEEYQNPRLARLGCISDDSTKRRLWLTCCLDLKAALAAYPKAERLLTCAVHRGCVDRDRIYCEDWCPVGAKAAYVPGACFIMKPYIYFCHTSVGARATDLEATLLEEAYHALTICDSGRRCGKLLADLERRLWYLPSDQRDCGMCLGREMLAKQCALEEGNRVSFERLLDNALGSCNGCKGIVDNTRRVRFLPMAQALSYELSVWSGNGANFTTECNRIDAECPATSSPLFDGSWWK